MSLTRSYKRTSMGPSRSCWNGATSSLQPEEITSKGIRVLCVQSIKVPARKRSGDLSNDPRIYQFNCIKLEVTLDKRLLQKGTIYIYIYIYYIIIVLVVAKSLCGSVVNQVQYNMDRAQHLG